MDAVFYVAAVIAILATVMVITRLSAVHALLYLIVSLLSVAVVFYTLGAPFIAALEVIIYAGAIMVLFVFVVMMLNLGPETTETERIWLKPKMWIGPCILSAILIAEVAYLLVQAGAVRPGTASVGPKEVGMALFGPYVVGVELASMLLLGALVGAYHLGKQKRERLETRDVIDSDATRAAIGGNPIRPGTGRPSRAA
jgi:NADH-quinone oxidoreductase subunit J